MKIIPDYLTNEEIAREIVKCIANATGTDIQKHNRKIRTHNSSSTAVWDFINTNLCKTFYVEEYMAYVIVRGPWEMAVLYCKKNGCIYTLMREKRFEELVRTQASRNDSPHYLDLIAGIINSDLKGQDFEQLSWLPKVSLDQEELRRQLLILLRSLTDNLDEIKRHVLVLFTANYETGLTAVRAVTVDPNLTIVSQANWSNYIDLNDLAVVETVDEDISSYDVPDMGIKLTKKAEMRKKSVAELRRKTESNEG